MSPLAPDDSITPLGIWLRMRRGARLAWRATGRGVIEFYNSENLTYASSIAYYALLSIFPFVLMVLNVVGRMAIGGAGDERALVRLVERALPSDFEFLSTQIVQLQRAPVTLTIAGALVTVWASMGVFGAITSAVDHAWGTEKPWGYFKHKAVAFVMMLTAALVFAACLLVTGAVQVSKTDWYGALSGWLPWLPTLSGVVARYILTPSAILAIGLIYYFAPNTRVRFRDVWYGAVLAGILWRLALLAFSWYLHGYARFSIHGSVGTVVAFLVWVYLSAVIVLYGVEVTAAYAKERHKLSQKSKVKSQK
jgi:membrane protein